MLGPIEGTVPTAANPPAHDVNESAADGVYANEGKQQVDANYERDGLQPSGDKQDDPCEWCRHAWFDQGQYDQNGTKQVTTKGNPPPREKQYSAEKTRQGVKNQLAVPEGCPSGVGAQWQ